MLWPPARRGSEGLAGRRGPQAQMQACVSDMRRVEEQVVVFTGGSGVMLASRSMCCSGIHCLLSERTCMQRRVL